ncbi:MAG: 4Fe-4S binding protein [Deltaproteobacteria bacterium]|nr:4Fe-4S binding protein [Deltaproteobacteria bacterium]
MENTIRMLQSRFQERGLQGRVVSVRHLQDLRDEIEGHHAQGLLNEEFYKEALSFFLFQDPENLPHAASLIVVAVPQPQTKVSFAYNGNTQTLILPPTYRGFRETTQQVQSLLTEWLAPDGYHVASARLPRKLLAVRSGLAEYGRNNIAYIPGMGSFFQPTVFFSDLPCPQDTWHKSRMMDRCLDCHVCLTKCPTGAITAERFLLRAERCLVFHNERSADHPFPDWIDPTVHHCLVGCMLCQQFCPEDKDFLNWFEGNETFAHEETALLLGGTSLNQLPTLTQEKLKRLDLLDYLGVLPRNLGVFFKTSGQVRFMP